MQKDHFERKGLKLHALDVRSDVAATLGINLNLTKLETINTSKRFGINLLGTS